MSGRVRFRRFFRHRSGALLSAFLGIGLALLCIHAINERFRPILVDLATSQVHAEIISLLHAAAEQTPFPFEKAVSLERDENGRVTVLQSNMSAAGTYRSYLVSRLMESIDTLQKRKVSVPLGSLTGVDILSGRGPEVPVKVLSVSVVHSEFENLFSSAGINQTRHQIILNITVNTRILLPGSTTQSETQFPVCVADTVIVGAVPEHFIQLDPGSTPPGS